MSSLYGTPATTKPTLNYSPASVALAPTLPLRPTTPVKTPVVSSKSAATVVNNQIKPVINTYDTALNAGGLTQAEANARDATATTDMKFLQGSGKPNPNYINPTTGQSTTTTTGSPLEDAQVNEVLHPGQTQLYNTRTGEQEWVSSTGSTPPGYSISNPKTRTDIADSVTDSEGNTINKLSDGSYSRIDINGNYTLGTSQMFSDASRVNDLNKSLDDARKGIYSPEQQNQLSGIQSQYQDLIDKQDVVNANTTGGTTIAMARSGLGNQVVGQQLIDKTVTDGIKAVQRLITQRDSAIATMKTSIINDDVDALKTAFDNYQSASEFIQKNIDKTELAVQAAKDKQDLSNRSNAITMGNKYLDTTDPILPSDTPTEVAEKVKTSPTWQNEQKTKSGQVDPMAVKGALEIWKKTAQLPTGFSGLAQNLKNAIYAAIGGAPDGTVDDAILNKAIISGKTKALNTQENQKAGTETSIKTLDKTIDLAEQYSNKVDRTGSPFFAKYANFLNGKVAGDADTAAFQSLVKTAASEYAKIMSGASSSISGATVSSVDNAEQIINAEMSKGQIQEVFNILKKDANFRLTSQSDTIDSLRQDIKDVGHTTSSSSGSTTSGTYKNNGAF